MMFFCTSAKNAKGRWRKIIGCLTDVAGKFREKHENQRRSKWSYVLALKCAEKQLCPGLQVIRCTQNFYKCHEIQYSQSLKYMFQVKIIFRLFYSTVINQVNLFQPRSVWDRKNTQATSHRSLFYQYRNNPNFLHMLALTGLKTFV